MKKYTFVLCLALLSSVSAFAGVKDGALFGKWNAPAQAVGGGLVLNVSMIFSDSGVTVTNLCTRGGVSVQVSASGDFETANGVLTVTGNQSQSQTQNGLTCDVSVQSGQVDYRFEGSSVLALSQGGQTMYFNKGF